MIQAVLFDLDDTLYAERDFFRGGFALVASLLAERGVGRAEEIGELLDHLHWHEGREGVLDRAAGRIGFPRQWVPELVDAFRNHTPRLRLPEQSRQTLQRLRGRYRLGIVTDGHRAVQRRKIEALGVAPLVDAIVVTDELGREHWKPDPLPFLECCRRLAVEPARSVFVGDHPERDVAGARGTGMQTVRLRSEEGYFAHDDRPTWEKADCEIVRIEELDDVLARMEGRLPRAA